MLNQTAELFEVFYNELSILTNYLNIFEFQLSTKSNKDDSIIMINYYNSKFEIYFDIVAEPGSLNGIRLVFFEFRFYNKNRRKGFTFTGSTFCTKDVAKRLTVELPISEEKCSQLPALIKEQLEKYCQHILRGEDFKETFYDSRLGY